MDKLFRKDAFKYHELGRPGKIEVIPTKPYSTQRDLSLAYTPGVADPCLAIKKTPEDVYKYTAKGNLVAVISNGTAVLGLGDIGPEAGKPVMEGKGLLFKVFGDVDVFDIEINEKDPDKFIEIVKGIAPTFGGINLEDIKAPECFYIEDRLKEELDIPLMHDDQHGTAIISSAALINALELIGKKAEDVSIVVSGAGAAAVSCTQLYIKLGVKPENVVMLDSRGVLHVDRTDMNESKRAFATDKPVHTLEEAIKGADVFLGLSTGGILTQDMIKTMASNPIVFAMANPTPEISYNEAMEARSDTIMGTGRSDFPNQINNLLGFPFIFRGALDVRASKINEEMKLAAAKALAELAKQPVPEEVNLAYGVHNLKFGKEYLIPKPTDPRLIETVAPAVAKAAMETGIAKNPIKNWEKYKEVLRKRMGLNKPLKRQMKATARKAPKRVVMSDAEHYNILKAAEIVHNEKLAIPILLGDKEKIEKIIKENELELNDIQIIDPNSEAEASRRKEFVEILYKKRQRKGLTLSMANEHMHNKNYYAPMLVETGAADTVLTGITRSYANTIRPALQVIGKKPNLNIVSGMHIVNTKEGPLFLSDTTVNKKPTCEELVEITVQTAEIVKRFNINPVVAMVSYSNFGTVRDGSPNRMRQAVKLLHERYPDLYVDGEIQVNVALNQELMKENFSFSEILGKKVNTLIFPNLAASNAAYKLLGELTDFEIIGPVLNGMNKPVHVLQLGSSVDEIVNMVIIAVMDAQKV